MKLAGPLDSSRERLTHEQQVDQRLLKVLEDAQEYQSEMDLSEAILVINDNMIFRYSRHLIRSAGPLNIEWKIAVTCPLKNAVIYFANEGFINSHMGLY